MCYISLSMLVSWCLNLEEKDGEKRNDSGKNFIASIVKFTFRWLPMAFVLPLIARTVHRYSHNYFMTIYLDANMKKDFEDSLADEVCIQRHAV